MAETLAIAGTAVSAIGTLVGSDAQATQARYEGKAQQKLANYQAAQLNQQAGQQRVTSQLQAIEEQRKARLAQSRAKAVAAASGGGTGGSVATILSRLASEGDLNANAATYEGEEAARGLEAQAAAERSSGSYANAASRYAAKNIRRAGYLSAAGTLIGGGAKLYSMDPTFYSKYFPKDETTSTPRFIGGIGGSGSHYQYG